MARTKKKSKGSELAAQTDPTAPLDSAAFLKAASPVLELLTKDLLERADASAGIGRAMRARHAYEHAQKLTADGYDQWRRQVVVQIAAGWLLSCVFVRTLEDRGLLPHNRIAGPGAMDAQDTFFAIAPYLTERDYLRAVFTELEHVPACKALFDREHNLTWRLAPSAAATKGLLALFRGPDAAAPGFRFGQSSTRFLGDLYQDLSEDVRKRYALLQTPEFIESFILDRTLEPAVEEFGLADTTVIDPTCGSGHFLLGAFGRLFEKWTVEEPGGTVESAVGKALASVYGVDVNPYAVSIARFRLTLAAVEKLGVGRISEVPALGLNVVVADSLLHGFAGGQGDFADLEGQKASVWQGEQFAMVDEVLAKAVLSREYAAVVGNPPYITVKDEVLRERYRNAYTAAKGTYSLAAPFMERFFGLCRAGGFTGQITANSFMKREFGRPLIEEVLPKLDLQLVVNTAGAYIPGHGTPTVLVFGRKRAPAQPRVHVVLARRGEPSTPEIAAEGEVWSSIARNWATLHYEDEFITVEHVEREKLAKHPWSLEGGGAAALKAYLEEKASCRLGDVIDGGIGRAARTGADEIFMMTEATAKRLGIPRDWYRPLVIGEVVRDWSANLEEVMFFPYAGEHPHAVRELLPTGDTARLYQYLWPYRAYLSERATFQGTMREAGRRWYEYMQYTPSANKPPTSITFAFVATHNHFVLDRGGKVFKQSAPIIKLPENATEDDHLALLAYLNSSTACFWMKQVLSPKGMHNGSEANATPFLVRYEFDGTKLGNLPLPEGLTTTSPLRTRLIESAQTIVDALQERDTLSFEFALRTNKALLDCANERTAIERRAVLAQEEIDWMVYRGFGIIDHSVETPDLTELSVGNRAFETRIRDGEGEPADASWHRWLGVAVEKSDNKKAESHARAAQTLATAHAKAPPLRLLESGSCKRRWRQPAGKAAQEPETPLKTLLDQGDRWLRETLERIVAEQPNPTTVAELVALLPNDWRRAKSLLGIESDDSRLVEELLSADAVPFLARQRYTSTGLEKYRAWEETWECQRPRDRGEDVDGVQAPPKFEQVDFRASAFWRARGKLDVPTERYISYPGCASDEDQAELYGWAGWDTADRAKALATLYVDRKERLGWRQERLLPILAGLWELLPRLKQHHNELDREYGQGLGDFFDAWLREECRVNEMTLADLGARSRGNERSVDQAVH